jgi:hypothetical protein
MTTITINEKDAQGKMLLQMIERFKGQPYITITDSKLVKSKTYLELKEALQDVKEGRVTIVKTLDV